MHRLHLPDSTSPQIRHRPSAPNRTFCLWQHKLTFCCHRSTINSQQGVQGSGWKKYIVYVQENGEMSSVQTPGPPRRKGSSSAGTVTGPGDSPMSSHAEPVIHEGPPLPADFFKAASANISSGSTFYVQPMGSPGPMNAQVPMGYGIGVPPSSYSTSQAGSTSHHSQSSHSSPRQPMRHHSMHGQSIPHSSPKMSSDGFGPIPGSPHLSRASTTTYASSTRSRATEVPIYPHSFGQAPPPPQFMRGATWTG